MRYLRRVIRVVERAWENRGAIVQNPQAAYHMLYVNSDFELDDNDSEDASDFDTELKEGYPSDKKWYNYASPYIIPVLLVLMPSWWPNHSSTHIPRRTLHKTAWLDGLRGVASFLVVIHHSVVLWFWQLSRGWGSSPDSYVFVQLPLIRLLYSGHAMVAIFFVVSGFSLSYKVLGYIRRGQYTEAHQSLSSSIIRRGFRLFLPAVFVNFIAMLAAYFDLYGVGPGSRQPPMSPFIWEHLKSWWWSVREITDPFRPMTYPDGYTPTYDRNLWTLPVEFNGSIIVFTTLFALSQVRSGYRLIALFSMVVYLHWYLYANLFLFLAGVLLAELHYTREDFLKSYQTTATTSLPDEEPVLERQYSGKVKAFWIFLFVAALYILSIPETESGGPESPGFRTLFAMIPWHYRSPFHVQDEFWVYTIAVFLVFILDNASFLQCLFTTRFAQYLGKISFALYICHGTILWTVGYTLANRLQWYTGFTPGLQYNTSIFLTCCVVYPLLFWVADIVARQVDAKSVKFARWVSLKITVPV